MGDRPWLVLGDFNEIVDMKEKTGGRSRSEQQMATFQDVLSSCELWDLRYMGQKFTWCNNREGMEKICKRLDRCVANMG